MSCGNGRTMKVGGADLHFATIEALEDRAKEEERTLVALNDGPLARNPRDRETWAKVERHAAVLRDLLFGLDDWVRDEEAELDRQIETLRNQIAGLAGNNL